MRAASRWSSFSRYRRQAGAARRAWADDALILSVHLPAQPQGARSTYLKAMDRQAFAFALVERVLLDAEPGERLFRQAAEAALADAAPLKHNAFKVPLMRTLVCRALSSLI